MSTPTTSSATSDDDVDSGGTIIFRAPIYCDAAQGRSPDYADITRFTPEWHSCDPYTIRRKVGRGKFSTVYLAYLSTGAPVALKVLVPVDIRRYLKEIKILENLRGHPNIVSLLDLTQDPLTGVYSLAFEWMSIRNWRNLYPKMTLADVRCAMRGLLRGLDYAHSRGIIHRDIKPDNFGIDLKRRKFKILDWGLAEFYMPGQKANPHAGTRAYMAPEQLLGYPYYNYAIDIWSAGLVFALMICRRIIFSGKENGTDQLFSVAKIIGGKPFINLLAMTELSVREDWITGLQKINGTGLQAKISEGPKAMQPPDALDLLMKMLKTDFRFRITAKDALQHPFIRAAPPDPE
jgi:casein kinase II subunit alpha